jgi:hypothetical protein
MIQQHNPVVLFLRLMFLGIECAWPTQVVAEKKSYAATMLDTKGPEIRTAMLKDGKDITIEAGMSP